METSQVASALPSADQLTQRIYDLHDVVRRHEDYVKTKYKISALEMEIIQFVVLEGRKKMKEIGDHFHVKLSTLTSIIDKIERQKLVKRVNSRDDRRVVFLEVTKKGNRLYSDYSQTIRVVSQMVGKELKENEFDSLLNGLNKFAELTQAASN